MINYIRRFLDTRHFLEVETPMMNMLPGACLGVRSLLHGIFLFIIVLY